ncbi:MAG: hypothetical protein KJ831_00630 [Candidatus Eisenbacteria bacterium]|nr:hypothetical protein [Candidatus Eisenbacteria bacterium]
MDRVGCHRAVCWCLFMLTAILGAGAGDVHDGRIDARGTDDADLTVFVQGLSADVRVESIVDPLGRGTADSLFPIPGCEVWDAVLDGDATDTNGARPVAMVHVPEPIAGVYRLELKAADSTLISVSGSIHRVEGGYCSCNHMTSSGARSRVLVMIRYETSEDSCAVSIGSQ